jgi:hypothetical protein
VIAVLIAIGLIIFASDHQQRKQVRHSLFMDGSEEAVSSASRFLYSPSGVFFFPFKAMRLLAVPETDGTCGEATGADSSFFTGRRSPRIIEEVFQYFQRLDRVFFTHQQLDHIHSRVGVRRKLARQHTGYFFCFENASRKFCVHVCGRSGESPHSHEFDLGFSGLPIRRSSGLERHVTVDTLV